VSRALVVVKLCSSARGGSVSTASILQGVRGVKITRLYCTVPGLSRQDNSHVLESTFVSVRREIVAASIGAG
jgi:hypothetical protein